MSTFDENLEQILTARYGKDVRQSIYEGILHCYEKVPILNYVQIVSDLPQEPLENTLYLLERSGVGFDEYIFIGDEWKFKGTIGSDIDINEYAKKEYVDEKIDTVDGSLIVVNARIDSNASAIQSADANIVKLDGDISLVREEARINTAQIGDLSNRITKLDKKANYTSIESYKNNASSILNNDLLLVNWGVDEDVGVPASAINNPCSIATEDASTLINSPITSGAFYAYREVFFTKSNTVTRITVRLTESYPINGRIWIATYSSNTQVWDAWRVIMPTIARGYIDFNNLTQEVQSREVIINAPSEFLVFTQKSDNQSFWAEVDFTLVRNGTTSFTVYAYCRSGRCNHARLFYQVIPL